MQQPERFLIIGQGLAGSLLAHFLLANDCEVKVIDQFSKYAASQVAAGIINPITGRRFVKSWKIDTLLPFARQTYKKLEEELGVSLYTERNIIRSLFNHREESDWLLRADEPPYQAYMAEEPALGNYAESTVPVYAYGEVLGGAQVHVAKFTEQYRQKLHAMNCMSEHNFEYDQLQLEANSVVYQGERFDQLIFCEGHRAVANPYFNYLPFGGAKGEVLIVRIPQMNYQKLLKHRVFIVPIEKDLYWIGATYNWTFKDEQPSQEGFQFLKERLSDFLQIPFEIVEHKAAIRPTVKDRRPFLGLHPQFPSLAIFNGLGTKGASLGPYWAAHFVQFLLQNADLDSAVDIKRFA